VADGGTPCCCLSAEQFVAVFARYNEAVWPAWAVALSADRVATGSGYPAMPMFGIAPCPVTIFTFGVLMLARGHVQLWLLAVPVTWSLIGGTAAFLLRVPQDGFLLVSGLVSVPALLMRERARRTLPA
jgi:hypothetical protein